MSSNNNTIDNTTQYYSPMVPEEDIFNDFPSLQTPPPIPANQQRNIVEAFDPNDDDDMAVNNNNNSTFISNDQISHNNRHLQNIKTDSPPSPTSPSSLSSLSHPFNMSQPSITYGDNKIKDSSSSHNPAAFGIDSPNSYGNPNTSPDDDDDDEDPTLPNSTHHSQNQQPKYKSYKRRWIGILGLSLFNILTSWGWLSFSAISSQTAELFGLSSEAPVNWLSTVILFSYIVASPIVSYVLHRWNVKVAMFICALLCITGNWLRYAGTVTQKFGLVMFGQILIGFAQPFALNSPTYYTDLWFTSKSRVSANAIASISNPFGGAIAQLVGPAIVSAPEDIKTFILVTACIASGASLIVFATPAKPDIPPCASATISKLSLLQSLRTLSTNVPFILAFSMFSIYVGLFNAYTTFINQIMEPYGYSSDEAGYTGAILIIAGIVCAAVTSPIIDRTHNFILLFLIALPLIAGCYISLIYTATYSKQLIGPFLVSGILGAISFSLLPALLEWIQEQTSPVSPAVSATLLWNGGQLFGAIFIISMDALKYGPTDGSPPGNMHRALIFQAVWASVGVSPIFFLNKVSKPNQRISRDTHMGDEDEEIAMNGNMGSIEREHIKMSNEMKV